MPNLLLDFGFLRFALAAAAQRSFQRAARVLGFLNRPYAAASGYSRDQPGAAAFRPRHFGVEPMLYATFQSP